MKKGKLITYWIATALLSIGMLQSGVLAVLRTKTWVDLIVSLGYPLYFLTIFGVWKILGVIAILIPRFPLLKEWAYAGFFFAMTGAFVSHLACHDYNIKGLMGPLMQTVFVILSCISGLRIGKSLPLINGINIVNSMASSLHT